ncbi:UPF0602 protein C4orf47 [Trichonephila inaurata madagascariensis]|uniref:Cilia-and flagella-associated protein 96 n=1 Tax=Trichonephila inaurata madagascariensis TaxID=2747483 RepID=A0A8X7CB24_9ARAC|nr:UPF0602 protein C4orf47 [Trichonephila inaurata madagascariensis]
MPPYFLEDEYEELKNTSHIPERPEPRPFKPYRAGLYQQEFFDPNPYKDDEPRPSPPLPQETELEESQEKAVFKPSSPAKKDGGMKAGCLNKFPEHTNEPFLKLYVENRGVKHHVDKENKIFRPVPKLKPYPIKSIITKNVEKKVTPRNFLATKGVVYCKK